MQTAEALLYFGVYPVQSTMHPPPPLHCPQNGPHFTLYTADDANATLYGP